jgi:peptidoglycan/xylan/chitin deacetylase (PgdA/CDA1 family)
MRRLLIVFAVILAGLAGLHRLARLAHAPALRRARRARGDDGAVVALSLDDGPTREHAPEVLTVLRERGVKATFFVVGAELGREPALARRIVAEGHGRLSPRFRALPASASRRRSAAPS